MKIHNTVSVHQNFLNKTLIESIYAIIYFQKIQDSGKAMTTVTDKIQN